MMKVKISFIDRLLGSKLTEKIDNMCHVECLKKLMLKNIKRGGRWGFVPLFGFTEILSSLFALMSFFYEFLLLQVSSEGYIRQISP